MKYQKVGVLKQAKRILRKRIKALLEVIPESDRKSQSEKIHKKLFELPVFKQGQRVSCYISSGMEVHTRPIITKLIDSGKLCFVPRYSIRKSKMELLLLNNLKELDTFPKSRYGVRQPSFSDVREEALDTGGLDVIIVPGLAFTPDGKRLGHGGGFYDKYIHQIRQAYKSRKITTIALAFKEQVFRYLPTHTHDVNIDIILTPK